MKKYPITYKGELYEVRWETIAWFPYILIYKETTSKFLKRKVYKQVYSEYEYDVNKHMKILHKQYLLDDPNLYIEQAITIFKLWEQSETYKNNKELTKQIQQQKLAEWDGVIE